MTTQRRKLLDYIGFAWEVRFVAPAANAKYLSAIYNGDIGKTYIHCCTEIKDSSF